MDNKVVFVVLHYENIQDTKECIKSIKKYLNRNVSAIIVDNGSKHEKLDTVELEYKNNEYIYFLYSKKNLGFAKGNNIGYKFAKENLNADVIILANNDLIFSQDNFIDKLLEKKDKFNFDIAGPKIMSMVDKKNQNPVRVQYYNLRDVWIRYIKYKILFILCIINCDLLVQKKVANEIEEFFPKKGEDFQLHGACIIISGDYLRKYNGLYDQTFMYGEEGILKYIVKRDNMKMSYFDDLCVQHKEGASTGRVHGGGRKKRKFYYYWNAKSCKLLQQLMRRDNKNLHISKLS